MLKLTRISNNVITFEELSKEATIAKIAIVQNEGGWWRLPVLQNFTVLTRYGLILSLFIKKGKQQAFSYFSGHFYTTRRSIDSGCRRGRYGGGTPVWGIAE
jgi:hypothetical protein